MTRRGASIQQLVATCLVILGLVFPLYAMALIELVLIGVLIWMLTGLSYFVLKYFYRGFRYGEWMEEVPS